MAAKWTPTVEDDLEDDFPSPTSETRLARDQLGRQRRIPFPLAKREEHLQRMAVGATGFVRGHAVQDPLDQLPDSVLPKIARLLHRD
jgi:hypothetical protein